MPQEQWSKIGRLPEKIHFQTQERWIKNLRLRVRGGGKKQEKQWLFRPRSLSNLQNLLHPLLCRQPKKPQVSDIQEAADGPARNFGRRHVEGLVEVAI